MTEIENVLNIAKQYIGTKENPPNSNNVIFNTWFYGREVSGVGYPWCMVFVQFVFKEAGLSDLLPVKTASCGALMYAAIDRGLWVTRDYRVGDILIYDFPEASGATNHTGICEKVIPGTVYAIEGNTAVGNNSNGGEVLRRTRSTSLVYGAVRPKYDYNDREEYDEMTQEQFNSMMDTWATQKANEKASPWALEAWEHARKAGIIDGTRPQNYLTRQEYAASQIRQNTDDGK